MSLTESIAAVEQGQQAWRKNGDGLAARRAVTAIDAALADLHTIRAELVTGVVKHDNATLLGRGVCDGPCCLRRTDEPDGSASGPDGLALTCPE